MNIPLLKTTACASVLALTAACTPTEQATVGGAGAGILAGSIASAAGLGATESALIGLGVGTVTAVTIYVIAKHQATERQRQIAEARAEKVYAGLPAEQKKQVQKKRYIAVDTPKDSRFEGQKAVMVYDTQNQKLVGNNVYDIQKSPSVGSTAKFDTYNATYLGS